MTRSRWLGAVLLVAATTTAHAQPASDAGAPAPTSDPAPEANPFAQPATAADSHDADLAAAADAAADAAAVIPPGDTAPAADTSAADAAAEEIDLAALGLDPSAESSFDDKLNIYGFADFNYSYMDGFVGIPKTKGFSSGKLNIYLAKNLTEKFRVLAEVRLMFLPNGSAMLGYPPSTAVANDPTSVGRPVEWGGIAIQRVYAEYDVNKYVSVRAGHWLTPYGIWNIDHGSPAIIPTMAPYVIGERLFPEAQTGLQAFGSVRAGDYKISYAATVSNGRSTVESTQDPDNRVALGGRLEVEAPLFGTLKLGVSGYGGRATVLGAMPGAPSWAYNERDVAADVQWDHGPLHLQGEYIRHERRRLDSSAPPVIVPSAAGIDTDDGKAQGFYGLAAFRTSYLWNVTPYAYFEHYRPLASPLKISALVGGLNFRPTPTLILKVQTTKVWLEGLELGDPTIFNAQAAWVF
jgi:hypothetical protein